MKKHLLLVLLLSILTVLSVPALAEDNTDAAGKWWSVSVDFRSQYVGSFVGIRAVNEAVIQPSITVSKGSYFANFWMSVHQDDPGRLRAGDEYDLSFGKNWKIGKVKNQTVFYYYNLYPWKELRADIFSIYNYAEFPSVKQFTPGLLVEWEIPENRKVLPGGVLYRFDVSRNLKAFERMKLVGTVSFGGHSGLYGFDPEAVSFGRANIAMPISVGGPVVLSPSITLQLGNGGIARNEATVGMNLSF